VDHAAHLPDVVAFGIAMCRTATIEHGALLSSLFLVGLLGSVSHCVGMCGPFVLGQVVARLEATPVARLHEFRRLTGAALAPYHFGRMTTYGLLGAGAGALAGGIGDVTGLRWLSAGLLALAALFFVGYALPRLGMKPAFGARSGADGLWSRHVARRLRPLFGAPVGLRGYLLGIMLGFLPCGLLYGAIAAAASSGSAIAGGLTMLAFVLGTIPALVGIGLAGHVTGNRWQSATARVTPVLLVLNAGFLGYMAWRMVA
jgi:uncharacterized protein